MEHNRNVPLFVLNLFSKGGWGGWKTALDGSKTIKVIIKKYTNLANKKSGCASQSQLHPVGNWTIYSNTAIYYLRILKIGMHTQSYGLLTLQWVTSLGDSRPLFVWTGVAGWVPSGLPDDMEYNIDVKTHGFPPGVRGNNYDFMSATHGHVNSYRAARLMLSWKKIHYEKL